MVDDQANGITREFFHAIIVVPLEEEFEVISALFQIVDDLSTDQILMYEARLADVAARFLLVKQNDMGKSSNREAFDLSLAEFDTALLVTVGIAGSISEDVKLGDVCYSGSIIDVTDNTKIKTSGDTDEILLWSDYYESPKAFTIPMERNRLGPRGKAIHSAWAAECGRLALEKLPNAFTGRRGVAEKIGAPKVHQGLLCCGLVSDSQNYNAKLKGVNRKVLAIETESGAMTALARLKSLPALAVRGISDYAGSGIDKNLFEQETSNQVRGIAAYNAGSYLAQQLSSEVFIAALNNSNPSAVRLRSPSSIDGQLDAVGVLLLRLSDDYDLRLRETVPSFSLQAKGYRLPIPRVLLSGRSTTVKAEDREVSEIRDALRETQTLILQIPPQYPDLSLAWIVANDLLTLQIDNKQVLPIVIEGSRLTPPRTTLKDLIHASFQEQVEDQSLVPVYVVDEFNFISSSRRELMKSEVEKAPHSKFVILTRSQPDSDGVSRFSQAIAAAKGQLTDISFMEMSEFVRKNFDLAPSASQVVAHRLRDTFKRFNLSAHPSYFARIPRDVLSALLQANRRAELLELATVGYLTFVATDKRSGLPLSRRTLESFLADLVFRMKVSKEPFTESALTSFAADFLRKYDFDLSPAQMVAAFISQGILHTEDGLIRFTLPFMESFLLARRLCEDETSALGYFTLGSEDFDFPTFSLYAELGASPRFVDILIEDLRRLQRDLISVAHGQFVVFEKAIEPAMLTRQDRLQQISDRLSEAEDDVRSNRDQSREKQRLLDASDRIAGEARAKVDGGGTSEPLTSITPVDAPAFTSWATALTLLGSGAERLQAGVKRTLIEALINLAVARIDADTRAISKADFKDFERDLLANTNLVDELAPSGNQQDLDEARKLIGDIAEFFECMMVMAPFLTTLMSLCDEARSDVLAESIHRTFVAGVPQNLIKNPWLTEINVPKGKYGLRKAIRDLPKQKLIRTLVTSHLMMRAFWSHWRREDRMDLLNIGRDSLSGIGLAFDVKKLATLLPSSQEEP